MSEGTSLSRALASTKPHVEHDEQARRYLQSRLEVYARVVFWAFVALRVLEILLYWSCPQVKPLHYPYIVALGVAGLLVMAVCWRGLIVRRTLSPRGLRRVDAIYTCSAGLVFAGTAALAPNRHEVGYICLVYSCFVVFMRALVVPSTGRFTLITSLLTLGFVAIAALFLAITTTQEIPGPAFFGGAATFAGFAVAISASGSRLIYGLRKQVDEHMLLGQYTLESKLGIGRTGEVYRARHLLLRRPTAIKVLRPSRFGADELLRIEREVQRMSQLTHPNTVAVFDYGHSPDGLFYYEMEFLDGITLEALITTDGPQHPGRVARILLQVCGALHEAHERGMLHRCLEPRAIMLCRRGGLPDVAKVLDFGLTLERAEDTTRAMDIRALGRLGLVLLGDAAVPVPLVELFKRCTSDDPPSSVRAVADQLQALQLDATWTDEEALAWWAAYDQAPSARNSMPAMTIEIELDARTLNA